MGSLILIQGISNKSITNKSNDDNLLIPIYCPMHDLFNGIKYLNGLPTLYMAFLKMSSFNNIDSINRIYSQKIGDEKFTTVITHTQNDEFSYRSNPSVANVFNNENEYHNYLFNLRWADYSSILKESDNILYLHYGNFF